MTFTLTVPSIWRELALTVEKVNAKMSFLVLRFVNTIFFQADAVDLAMKF